MPCIVRVCSWQQLMYRELMHFLAVVHVYILCMYCTLVAVRLLSTSCMLSLTHSKTDNIFVVCL